MKKRLKTPRPYLSYSQKVLFDNDPDMYRQVYFEGKTLPVNKYMRFGRLFADIMESDEKTSGTLELVRVFAPREPKQEYKIKVNADGIPLFGILDQFNPYSKPKRIREDKTGKKWTQRMVDKNEQLTFYAYMVYLKYGKIPDLFLDWFKTKVVGEDVQLTGDITTFRTKRTLKDLLFYHAELNRTWVGIKEMAKEYV